MLSAGLRRSIVIGALLSLAVIAAPVASAATPSGFVVVHHPVVGDNDALNAVAAVSSSDVWAVGYYNGGSPLIDHWNGSSWSHVKAPVGNVNAELNAISVAKDKSVWAVGYITTKTGEQNALVLRLVGSTWKRVTVPAFGNLAAVYAFSASNVWVGGQNENTDQRVLGHWNGASWSTVADDPVNSVGANQITGLSGAGAGQLFVTGRWYDGSRWQGWFETRVAGKWTFLGSTPGVNSSWQAVSASSTTNAWAAGWTSASVVVGRPIAAQDNASGNDENDPPGYPGISHVLEGVVAISPTDVWAVGGRGPGAGPGEATLIDHYNGSAWTDLGGPNQGSDGDVLVGITAVPGNPNDLWAVGSDFTTLQPIILHHAP